MISTSSSENHLSIRENTKFLGVEFAPISTPWERRLQTLGVVVWCAMSSFIPFGVLYFLIFLCCNFILGLLYLAWIYVDRETPNLGGRRFTFVRSLRIWKYYADYFPLRLIKTADLDPKRNYLLCAHPHGIFCSGPFGSLATEALDFSKLFPKMTPYFLTLRAFFWIPFARDFFLSFGACPATKKSMNYILSQPGGGNAALLIPGGVPEMLESRPNTDLVKIKTRKGFIKVALQNGSPLVPVYSFGETNVYDQLFNPEGSFVRRVQLAFIKLTGFYVPFVNGRGIFQYTLGTIPRRIPVTTVVGAPIDVEKTSNPTQEQIDSLHDKFVKSLEALFYSHREECGYPTAEIKII